LFYDAINSRVAATKRLLKTLAARSDHVWNPGSLRDPGRHMIGVRMDDSVVVGSDVLANRINSFVGLTLALASLGFSPISVVLLAGGITLSLACLPRS